jgi:uncharacterized Zn-finger protein
MQGTSASSEPNHKATIHITQSELPLACPLPQATLWNVHPRVYLPVEKTGEATCPYCGTHFILDDFERDNCGHS